MIGHKTTEGLSDLGTWLRSILPGACDSEGLGSALCLAAKKRKKCKVFNYPTFEANTTSSISHVHDSIGAASKGTGVAVTLAKQRAPSCAGGSAAPRIASRQICPACFSAADIFFCFSSSHSMQRDTPLLVHCALFPRQHLKQSPGTPFLTICSNYKNRRPARFFLKSTEETPVFFSRSSCAHFVNLCPARAASTLGPSNLPV